MALTKLNIERPAEDGRGVPRDRYKRPLIHVPNECSLCKGTAKKAQEHKLIPYTRTTTFNDCIEDKSALGRYDKRNVLLGATKAPELVAEAQWLDPEDPADKKRLNEIAEKLVSLSGADAKREKGSDLHEMSEYVDRGEPLPEAIRRKGRPLTPVTEADVADMAAYKLATIDLEVQHIERLVVCDELRVAGTPDRVIYYHGPGPDGLVIDGNLIADLKTGTLEYGALKMAIQLAIYARGEFYDSETMTRSPMPEIRRDWGIIINLPPGSETAELHWLDLSVGWDAALLARDVRAMRNMTKKVLRPFRVTPSP
ncbi:hypothetical protein [Plantactinospora sp. WMMB782]|uniref:hypothetical protein n=1 Tax=Plantactinospora sp. WMMB782 TaxID=3404121 RepID=UPI003B93009A